MTTSRWAAALLAFAVGAVSTLAATLSEGDPAPKLTVSKWAQGEPVAAIESGKVYIVEFWATWCPPCRESIPHLNQIHNKFKDKGLVVIGVDLGETLDKVNPFIKRMGSNMTYRVAMDADKDNPSSGSMATNWLGAAGINTIPTAFVVDQKGTIVFIGLPMELTDAVIQEVLDGKFDAKKAVALHKKAIEEQESQQKDAVQKQESLRKLSAELESNIKEKQWDKANAALDEIEKLIPANRKPAVGFMRVKLLVNRGDAKGASKLATQLGDEFKDDSTLLNALAWELITESGITERDLPLAEKLAIKANELSEGKQPQVLDTLARVLFLEGKKDQAIETQAKAVAMVDGELKEMLQKHLDSYKADKLPSVEQP